MDKIRVTSLRIEKILCIYDGYLFTILLITLLTRVGRNDLKPVLLKFIFWDIWCRRAEMKENFIFQILIAI